MSKGQKLFLLILALVVILYLVVTTFGLLRKDDPKAHLKSPAWISTLNKVFSGFATRVELAHLQCNGHAVGEFFELSFREERCVIELDDGLIEEEDFWKTDIAIWPQTSPDFNIHFLAKYPAPREGKPLRIPDNCRKVEEENVDKPGWLGVILTPDDEDDIEHKCWIKADDKQFIPITITGPTTLELFCWECTEENKKKIKLRLNP